MEQENTAIDEYLELLNSKAPVPGGGGVSALTGALAAGLATMVTSLTIGKKKYADVELQMTGTSLKIKNIQSELIECMNADAEAFEPLSKAYGMPKATPEEQALKEETMEKCLKAAAKPPVKICELVAELYEYVRFVADNGSRLAVSDAGCAAALSIAAIKAAALNVYVNTRLMKDKEYAQEVNAHVDELMTVTDDFEEIYETVLEVLK